MAGRIDSASMKAEIAKAPAEMVPVMDAILANWYWHFFQQNRWRFLQRTQTEDAGGDDILTWSLPRILDVIDKQFTKALAADKMLKATPIADYDAVRITSGIGSPRPQRRDHEVVGVTLTPPVLAALGEASTMSGQLGRTSFTVPPAVLASLRALARKTA